MSRNSFCICDLLFYILFRWRYASILLSQLRIRVQLKISASLWHQLEVGGTKDLQESLRNAANRLHLKVGVDGPSMGSVSKSQRGATDQWKAARARALHQDLSTCLRHVRWCQVNLLQRVFGERGKHQVPEKWVILKPKLIYYTYQVAWKSKICLISPYTRTVTNCDKINNNITWFSPAQTGASFPRAFVARTAPRWSIVASRSRRPSPSRMRSAPSGATEARGCRLRRKTSRYRRTPWRFTLPRPFTRSSSANRAPWRRATLCPPGSPMWWSRLNRSGESPQSLVFSAMSLFAGT